MARIEGKCIGDCSKCELLAAGEVDMVPCILDQMFARVRKQGAELAEIKKESAEIKKMLAEGNADKKVLLAGIEGEEAAPEAVADVPEEEKEV